MKGEKIMAMLTGEWLDAMQEEFQKSYYKELYQFVKEEYDSTLVFPPADNIFNAMHFTPLNKVKVLLLGQDPYHNVNQAHGLSFSVLPSQTKLPPSLQNIYKELQETQIRRFIETGLLRRQMESADTFQWETITTIVYTRPSLEPCQCI